MTELCACFFCGAVTSAPLQWWKWEGGCPARIEADRARYFRTASGRGFAHSWRPVPLTPVLTRSASSWFTLATQGD